MQSNEHLCLKLPYLDSIIYLISILKIRVLLPSWPAENHNRSHTWYILYLLKEKFEHRMSGFPLLISANLGVKLSPQMVHGNVCSVSPH